VVLGPGILGDWLQLGGEYSGAWCRAWCSTPEVQHCVLHRHYWPNGVHVTAQRVQAISHQRHHHSQLVTGQWSASGSGWCDTLGLGSSFVMLQRCVWCNVVVFASFIERVTSWCSLL
jgi:hypothetical protein